MEQFRSQRGFDVIAYGVNVDDQGDYRPGQQAARQHGVAAPLLEAGLTKAEFANWRALAGLRIWDKPASACLSSRIEYGRPVTPEALCMPSNREKKRCGNSAFASSASAITATSCASRSRATNCRAP